MRLQRKNSVQLIGDSFYDKTTSFRRDCVFTQKLCHATVTQDFQNDFNTSSESRILQDISRMSSFVFWGEMKYLLFKSNWEWERKNVGQEICFYNGELWWLLFKTWWIISPDNYYFLVKFIIILLGNNNKSDWTVQATSARSRATLQTHAVVRQQRHRW